MKTLPVVLSLQGAVEENENYVGDDLTSVANPEYFVVLYVNGQSVARVPWNDGYLDLWGDGRGFSVEEAVLRKLPELLVAVGSA